MPVQFKDYYEVLGLSRAASPDQVRSAFRRLARQYHPDVAQDKILAETRFRELTEAYEVLGSAEKRKRYDAWSAEITASRSRQAARAPFDGKHRGDNFEFYGQTDFSAVFQELFTDNGNGKRRARERNDSPPQSKETHTGGRRGQDAESEIVVNLTEVLLGAVRPISLKRQVLCESCFGIGNVNGGQCRGCHGKGFAVVAEQYQVRIPRGVLEGQRLKIPGQGERLVGGGEPGDLYLRVKYDKHPVFTAAGEDLQCEITVAAWQAALGGEITVPALDGSAAIRLPPCSQQGQRIRLRGKGLPSRFGGRGDLIVILRVQMPARLSARERALWEELSREAAKEV